MKLDKFFQSLLLTSAITLTGCFAYVLLLGTPAKGEEVGENIQAVNKNISHLSEVKRPATSAQMLVQIPSNPSSVAPDQGNPPSVPRAVLLSG